MKTHQQNHLKRACLFVAALSLSLAPLCTQAGTLWFDGTGNADPGDGASSGLGGSWNTTTTNWDVGFGLPHVAWDNTANSGDTAAFGNLGNSAATVTVGTVSAGGLDFSSTGGGTTTRWTLSGGALTLGSGATINASAMDSRREASISLNAVLTGDVGSGLTLMGGGTINGVAYESSFNSLTTTPRVNCLSVGGANTFTGPVTISNVVELGGATVALGRFPSLGASGKNVTLSQGTLELFNQGTFTFDHNLIVDGINNAVATHNTSSYYTLSGSLSSKNGSSDVFWSLARTAPSRLTYTGNLAGFTGTFYARGAATGTNVIDNADSFGGTFYVDSGTLQIGNGDTKGSLGVNSITNNGTIIYKRTDSLAYAGNFSGTGKLNASSGTLLLNGVNTHTGATTVATNATLAGSGSISGPVTLLAGGTLGAGTASIGTLTLSGTLTLNASSTNLMRINKSGSTLTSDRITGLPGLAYAGTLTVTATGDTLNDGDTFTLFTIASGAYSGGFAVINLPSLPSGKSWDLTQMLINGSVRVAGGAAPPGFWPPAGNYVGAQTVTISSTSSGATIYYTTDGSTPTASSPSGASPVTVTVPTDATTVVKAYASAPGYDDSTVASATYVTLSTPTWLNAAGGSWATAANWLQNVIATGIGAPADFSTLTLGGDTTVTLDSSPTVGALRFADTSSTGNWILNSGTGGPLTLNAGTNVPVITVGNQTATIGATLAGTNGLTKKGDGVLVFAAANSFTGNVTISNGLVRSTMGNIGSNTGLGVSNTVTVAAGATLDIGGANGTGNQLGASPGNTLTVNGGTLNFSLTGAAVQDGPYLGTLNLNGASVTSTNADGSPNGSGPRFGYNSPSGVINATGSASTWSAPIWLLAGSGKSMTINAVADLAVAGVISDYSGLAGLPLIKTGAGTLTLSGGNFYTGTTTVSNGTLVLEGPSGALGTGAVTVEAGATLAGTGTFNGATTIRSGGTLAIGTTNVGVMTLYNTLTLNAGATNCMKIDKTGGSLTADAVQGLTSVTYGGTLNVTNITSDTASLALNDSFTLFPFTTYAGAFTNFVLPPLPTGLNWDKSQLLVNGSIRVIAAASTPTITPPGGGYIGEVPVTISSDSGSTIFYTTNGSDPTSSSPHGPSPVSITIPVDATVTVKAYATNTGVADSGIAMASYDTQPAGVWISTFDGSWTGTWNWLNGIVPNASRVPANFNTLTLTADTTVSVDGPQTVGHLVFGDVGNAFNWILTNGTSGSLVLDNGANSPVINVSNLTTTLALPLAGTSGLTKEGNGTLALANSKSTLTGNVIIPSGVVKVAGQTGVGNSPTTSALGNPQAPSVVTVSTGATLQIMGPNLLGQSLAMPVMTFVVDGGTITNTGDYITTLGAITLKNGAVLTGGRSSGGTAYQMYSLHSNVTVEGSSPSFIATGSTNGVADGYHLNAPTVFDVANVTGDANVDLTVSGRLVDRNGDWPYYGYSGVGSLVKVGAGTMLLTATNAYTGATTVSNGTLIVNGTLRQGLVTVAAAATLGGTGSVGGAMNVEGTLTPAGSTPGALTVSGTLTLSSTATSIFRISKGGTSDAILATTNVVYGGTLNVTSVGAPLATGDSFQLFPATSYTGAFSATNLPTLGTALKWDWNPATGILSVVSAGPSGPGSITSSVTGGNTLNLTWPAGQGWRLVSQTNNLAVGLDPNPAAWGTVPGVSDGSASLTIDPTKPTVFYRLVYP